MPKVLVQEYRHLQWVGEYGCGQCGSRFYLGPEDEELIRGTLEQDDIDDWSVDIPCPVCDRKERRWNKTRVGIDW